MYDCRRTDTCSLTWLDLFVVWIVAVSLAAVFLLVLERFSGLGALAGGTLLSALLLLFLRPSIVSIRKIPPGLLLIILVALCCRLQPYIWIMGWQDPGTYVNMAAHYERHGSTFIKDSFRESLTAQEKKYYDNMVLDDLSQGSVNRDSLSGTYPLVNAEILAKFNLSQLIGYASIIPGIYIKNLDASEYVFQFYPLHPIWMAIFSSLFGETAGPYSLTFFALLTIVMFYRLAKVLSSGDEKTGLIAAGLLAINPLHSFFSKFPVTEVCFLFFTVSGFYYLANYVRDREEGRARAGWHLPLSAALFLCAFLTRVTGFLYMPFFYLLAGLLFISRGDPWRVDRKAIFSFALAVIGAYAVSLCYGLTCSYPYTMEQFGMSIGKAAVANWQVSLLCGLSVLLFLPIAGRRFVASYWGDGGEHLLKPLKSAVVFVMFAILVAGAALAGYRLLHDGFDAFSASTGVAAVSYISPVAFILLIIFYIQMGKEKKVEPLMLWLALFVALFWGFYVLVLNRLPYQYYYARYLLSEVVPYSLLLVALCLGRMMALPERKAWAYLAVAAIAVYLLYFTACQLRGREADGAYAGLKKVAERVQKDDILFITFNDFKLLTPLRYFFGLNTFRIREGVISEKAGKALSAAHNAYILAKSPVERSGAILVEVIDYRQGELEHSQHIPVKFAYIDQMKLYLYRIDKSQTKGF